MCVALSMVNHNERVSQRYECCTAARVVAVCFEVQEMPRVYLFLRPLRLL